jgi:hypothetical protein
MRRLHLVELEDLPWFPATIRDLGTDFLRFMGNLGYPFGIITERVAEIVRATGRTRIVDLCSGGAGPVERFARDLQAQGAAVERVTLTDKYPNRAAFAHVAGQSSGLVDYIETSVDATDVPADMHGLRTIFNAFHHFRPDMARAILQDAVNKREPIAVFEMLVKTSLPSIAIGSPLAAVMTAPFIRPFSWRRILFSWIIPLVPMLVAFDGIVSCLRIYSPEELQELVDSLENTEGYRFEIGRKRKLPFEPVTYLLGWPE